jgi:hypothetical protein
MGEKKGRKKKNVELEKTKKNKKKTISLSLHCTCDKQRRGDVPAALDRCRCDVPLHKPARVGHARQDELVVDQLRNEQQDHPNHDKRKGVCEKKKKKKQSSENQSNEQTIK